MRQRVGANWISGGVAVAMLLAICAPVAAAPFTWSGANQANWVVAGNWSPGGADWTTAANDFTISNNAANVAWMTTNTTFTSKLTIGSNGVIFQMGGSNPRTLTDLHLAGGALKNSTANTGSLNGSLTADASTTSTMDLVGSAGSGVWSVGAQLKGTGTLNLTQSISGQFNFTSSATDTNSFSGGTLNVGSGVTAQFGDGVGFANPTMLQGGTMNVNNGGIWLVSRGTMSGQVNINAGGIATQDNTNTPRPFQNVHLNGGTLRGFGNDNANLGGNAGSSIFVDANSTLGSLLALGQDFYIRATLNGAQKLTVNTTTSGSNIRITAPTTSATTYTGNWDIQNGNLIVMNAGAAGDGNYALGGGDIVNIASAKQLLFEDRGASPGTWDIRHTITGQGTVGRVLPDGGSGTLDDTLVVRRSNDDTRGGFSPGNSAGILNVAAPLDFQLSNANAFNPQLTIQVTGAGGVAGADFDRLAVTGNVTGINNLELIVDVDNALTQANLSGDALAILTSMGTITGAPYQFASITSLNPNWTFDVSYQSNQIVLSNFALQADEEPTAVPEPASCALAAVGLLGMALLARRRTKNRAAFCLRFVFS